MENHPYYLAYEKRYQTVYNAGVPCWGHSPNDEELYRTLKQWVADNHLAGKHIIEYACGEGAGGVILSELGCYYHGVDISPSAIEKAREALKKYSSATVCILDMVKEAASGEYDAALDCMGLHMLVTDTDRLSYLKNALCSLKGGAPMLFFKESYNNGLCGGAAVAAPVNTYQEWLKITGSDYKTPMARQVILEDGHREVMLPLVPSRAKDRGGYIAEMELAGFSVEKFVEMDVSQSIPHSASIYVRKPSL